MAIQILKLYSKSLYLKICTKREKNLCACFTLRNFGIYSEFFILSAIHIYNSTFLCSSSFRQLLYVTKNVKRINIANQQCLELQISFALQAKHNLRLLVGFRHR